MTIEEMQQRNLALGYSNEEIARRSGVPLGTIMKIFSGATKAPRRATVLALEKDLAPAGASCVREAPYAYVAEPSYNREEKKYTLDDYYALPEERRAELIDGVFYDIASPSSNHQIIIGELYLQLKLCERAHKGACRVLLSPLDVQLDQDRYTMLQPDLAIEILSPSSHSRDLVPVSISEGECVIDFEEISSMLV